MEEGEKRMARRGRRIGHKIWCVENILEHTKKQTRIATKAKKSQPELLKWQSFHSGFLFFPRGMCGNF